MNKETYHDFYSVSYTWKYERFYSSIALLERLHRDCFDANDPHHTGLFTVDKRFVDILWGEVGKRDWEYICQNASLFEAILPQLGLSTKGGIHLEGTVLVKE